METQRQTIYNTYTQHILISIALALSGIAVGTVITNEKSDREKRELITNHSREKLRLEKQVHDCSQIEFLTETTEEPTLFTYDVKDNRRLVGTTTDGTRHTYVPTTNGVWQYRYTTITPKKGAHQ